MILTFFLASFSMVMITRGSSSSDPERPGTSDKEILRIISAEVATPMREAIPEMFKSVKTTLIDLFDKRYTAFTEVAIAAATTSVATARLHGGYVTQYQEFNNMKSPKFDGVMEPIDAMRWISNVKGCFYTCLCL